MIKPVNAINEAINEVDGLRRQLSGLATTTVPVPLELCPNLG